MGSFSETYNDPLQIKLSFVSYKEITCKGKKNVDSCPTNVSQALYQTL